VSETVDAGTKYGVDRRANRIPTLAPTQALLPDLGSGAPSRPDDERITDIQRVAREDQAQKHARATSGILLEKHDGANDDHNHLDRRNDTAIVAGVPVRDRTLKAPIREWKKC